MKTFEEVLAELVAVRMQGRSYNYYCLPERNIDLGDVVHFPAPPSSMAAVLYREGRNEWNVRYEDALEIIRLDILAHNRSEAALEHVQKSVARE